MKKGSTYILSGPVGSGKSTALQQWVQKQQSETAGFLHLGQPKKLHLLPSQESIELEKGLDPDASDILVGKYRFSSMAFKKMNETLLELTQWPSEIMVIDEIGKLELKEEGIFPGLISFIDSIQEHTTQTSIFVVRDYLLEEVIEKFGLRDAVVIDQNDLNDWE